MPCKIFDFDNEKETTSTKISNCELKSNTSSILSRFPDYEGGENYPENDRDLELALKLWEKTKQNTSESQIFQINHRPVEANVKKIIVCKK